MKACTRKGVVATHAVLDSLLEQCQEPYSLVTTDMLVNGIACNAGGAVAAAGDAGAEGKDAGEDEDEPGPARSSL